MSDNDDVFILIKMFLSFTPLKKIKTFIRNGNIILDLDTQENILKRTVRNDLMKRYPLKMSYQKAFLKCVIQELELRNEDILDDLYKDYCSMISSQDESSETHYCHFILGDDSDANYITIQESINVISQGTTGMCSWQAASVLSEWCIENKTKLDGKVILELGSGVGLLGLSVIRTCSPKQYIFTDGHVKVLSLLCRNVITNLTSDLNMEDVEVNDKLNLRLMHNKTEVMIKYLLWEDIQRWIRETDIKPDIILAADILFDSSVFAPLVCGLKEILSLHKIQGYIAATVRNESTIDAFFNQLDEYNISYQDEDAPRQKIFVHKEDTTVRVIKIS